MATLIYSNSAFSQVGFNNPNPHASSIVDLTANNKGLLVPRMTSAQRNAIVNPANGLLVFDISLKSFCVFDTVSNPDKWLLLSATKADANSSGNAETVTTGNFGIGVTDPVRKLEVNGAIKAKDTVFAPVAVVTGRVIANEISGNGTVPAGAIMMWQGTTPPTGWAICDGSNGTPDLRGRFIVGSGTNQNPASGDINPTYSNGNTGGENQHLLIKTEIPKHQHSVSSSGNDNGQVTIANATTNDNHLLLGPGSPLFLEAAAGNEYHSITSQPTHTHSINGTTGDGTTDGVNGQRHENRPPFYALTYIMKL